MQQYNQWLSTTGGSTSDTSSSQSSAEQSSLNIDHVSNSIPVTIGNEQTSRNPQQESKSATLMTQSASESTMTISTKEKFLLWCVNSKPLRTHLAHILVHSSITDMEVFQTLRTVHHKIRSWKTRMFYSVAEIRFVQVFEYDIALPLSV